MYAGVVRVFLFLHGQFLLWALGHTFGHQPYSDNHTGRNNTLLSILSLGEGYLNFHREFPGDYRMGCFYYHMDATKWFLRLLSVLRLGTPPRDRSGPVPGQGAHSVHGVRTTSAPPSSHPSLTGPAPPAKGFQKTPYRQILLVRVQKQLAELERMQTKINFGPSPQVGPRLWV